MAISCHPVTLAIAAFAGTAAGFAASPPSQTLPPGCSPADQALVASYSQTALDALAGGDSERFVRITQALEAKISPACRTALARTQPARVQCSADDRRIVLSSYQAIMRAAAVGDQARVFRLLESLSQSISAPCWIALNHPQDDRIRLACSSPELEAVAATTGPLMRAVMAGDVQSVFDVTATLEGRLSRPCWIALNYSPQMQAACSPSELDRAAAAGRPLLQAARTGDFRTMLAISQNLQAQLSQRCQTALSQSQAQAQARGGVPRWSSGSGGAYRLPAVQDHGGGTYSMAGVGACTPGGCVPF